MSRGALEILASSIHGMRSRRGTSDSARRRHWPARRPLRLTAARRRCRRRSPRRCLAAISAVPTSRTSRRAACATRRASRSRAGDRRTSQSGMRVCVEDVQHWQDGIERGVDASGRRRASRRSPAASSACRAAVGAGAARRSCSPRSGGSPPRMAARGPPRPTCRPTRRRLSHPVEAAVARRRRLVQAAARSLGRRGCS